MSAASAVLAEIPAPSARTLLAVQGYLARYTGTTFRTYEQSLSLLFRFLLAYGIDPLDAKRPHLELYMRQYLEQDRRCSPVSVNHHMTPVRGFFKYAVIDDYLTKDPTLGLLMPKVWVDEWRNDWVKDPELRALLTTANQSARPSDAGLIALLVLLGLRISECLNVQVEDFAGVIDGYRVLRLVGKGNKPATMPLPIGTLQMLERAAGGRESGPLLLRDTSSVRALDNLPMTYRAARIALSRIAREAGIERKITPHMCRRGVITVGLMQGISMEKMQILARHEDPRTTSSYDRSKQNLHAHAVHALTSNLLGR